MLDLGFEVFKNFSYEVCGRFLIYFFFIVRFIRMYLVCKVVVIFFNNLFIY